MTLAHNTRVRGECVSLSFDPGVKGDERNKQQNSDKSWVAIAFKMLIDDTGLNNASKPNSNSTDVPNWCLSH